MLLRNCALGLVALAAIALVLHANRTTELSADVPYPVKSLQHLSARLLKRDESASFRASVAAGKESKLLSHSDDATKALLSSSPSSSSSSSHSSHSHSSHSHSPSPLSSEDDLTLAKTVAKMFPHKSIKELSSKKSHASGAKDILAKASRIESNEEAAALRAAISTANSHASTFRDQRRKIMAADKRDSGELERLKRQIKRHRNALVGFGRAAQKEITSKAEIQAEAKMLDHAAKRLEDRAKKLKRRLEAAKDHRKKSSKSSSKSSGVHLSKREERLLARNKKLITHYNHLNQEMHADERKAKDIMKRAALARTKALASMHRAGSLLAEADHSSSDGDGLGKKGKKIQAKLRGQSGSLTRKAVSLLMGTHEATHKAYEWKHKARELEVQLDNMKDSVHAARLSDRILEDPDLLQHPTEFDAAETSQGNGLSIQAKKKVSADEKRVQSLERLAKADRGRANQLETEARLGKPAHLLSAAHKKSHLDKATQEDLIAQEKHVQAKELRQRRRNEAELARQLGDEMNKQQRLRANIKARQTRLNALEKEEERAERRGAFESSVLRRVTQGE